MPDLTLIALWDYRKWINQRLTAKSGNRCNFIAFSVDNPFAYKVYFIPTVVLAKAPVLQKFVCIQKGVEAHCKHGNNTNRSRFRPQAPERYHVNP